MSPHDVKASNGAAPEEDASELQGVGDNNNPMPHLIPEGENATPLEVLGCTATDKLLIIMVGLPATGKTHISKRICRYLNFFMDIPTQIFNVGDYRRQLCGAQMPASFYDPTNAEAVAQRTMACDAALADMMDYMRMDGVRVAVYDATNSTKSRRIHLLEVLKREGLGAKVMFMESICDSPEILEENIRKVKLSTPDYKDMDPKAAAEDFKARRRNYESVYETLDASDGSFIKMFNCKKFVINNVRGYLPLKIVHFAMNLHTLPRNFYLTRHGESEYNALGKIGGDSMLSKIGIEYARRLAQYAKEEICHQDVVIDEETGESITKVVPARLWTSTMRRTRETAKFIERPTIRQTWDNGDTIDWVQMRPVARRNLDDLYAGACDGMTYAEIEEKFPEEFERRQKDRLAYRYPRGESYLDVILRLEPLAHEMERTREPLLIIGHQGILRILYAYFMGLSRAEAPYVQIPLGTVVKLSPHTYGCEEKHVCLMDQCEILRNGENGPIAATPTF